MNQKIKLFCVVLLGAVFFLTTSVQAKKNTYQDATIRLLNNHLFEEKMIDFDNPESFKEYVMIEDCPVFEKFYTNDFDWNRIRLAIKAEADSLQTKTKKQKIRVPGFVVLTRYNFSTQSFDIHQDYVFENVGFLQLLNDSYDLCGGKFENDAIGKGIPGQYLLKPEVPLNLYRIPVSKILAQRILDTIKPNKDSTRDVYIDINVTLDTFSKVAKDGRHGMIGHILGTIDHIDFYTDEFRRDKFKTLYYDVY